MLAFFSRLFGQFALAGCCLSLNMLLVSFAILIRRLPALLDLARRALRGWLVLSYRLYSAVLSALAPLCWQLAGLNLVAWWPRTLLSLGVSLLSGVGLHLLLGLPPRLWTLIPFALHGLVVGALWDELTEPGGIRLGERL